MSVAGSGSIRGTGLGHRAGEPGVCSAARVLAVLKYLARSAQPVPAREIVQECQVPKSSLYQLLRVMHARRFVTYYPLQRSWGLGLASFQIGSLELRELPLERLGAPVLSGIAAAGTAGVRYANLAVLKGNEVENLLVVNAPGVPVHTVCNGMRLPAHQTAVGRAILMYLSQDELETIYPHSEALPTATTAVSARVGAGDLARLCSQLDRARNQGYVVVERPASGISAIAAAVFDYAGQPIAGVGISVSRKPDRLDKAPQLVENVRQAARTLSTHLGWQEDGSRR